MMDLGGYGQAMYLIGLWRSVDMVFAAAATVARVERLGGGSEVVAEAAAAATVGSAAAAAAMTAATSVDSGYSCRI